MHVLRVVARAILRKLCRPCCLSLLLVPAPNGQDRRPRRTAARMPRLSPPTAVDYTPCLPVPLLVWYSTFWQNAAL